MAKLFDSIRVSKPKLNKFDLSHERKMSLNMGDLVPILFEEVMPGDKFRVNTEVLLRMAPMLAPMMHRVNVICEFWFVPNRILWNEFEDGITGGVDGLANPQFPYFSIGDAEKLKIANGTLGDYMGLPDLDTASPWLEPVYVSALPFRAYQLIYDEFYRDQTLSAKINCSRASGGMNAIPGEVDRLTTMRKRSWEKDYFTSALPFAQRGGAVSAPITGDGGVTYLNISDYKVSGSGAPANFATPSLNAGQLEAGLNVPTRVENIDQVTLDTAAITINELRRAVRLQEWLEKNARGGARYIEQILSHFGVVSSDARLQRPEFLGGHKVPIVISEVLSTFQTDGPATIPQGNMAGHGVSVGSGNGFSRRFEEHGVVLGIMSVLPRTSYQQGLARKFTRFDRFDYPWPEFAHLGEQEVKQKEILCDPTQVGTQDTTFGYQSRYCEFKYGYSSVHGDFRNSLAFWHMGRIFGAAPALNEAFIKADPTTRIFAVEEPGVHHLYAQLYHKMDCLRPLPYYGTPGL